jgi:ElaB/YqjD/DUF883 family membrane-anchored ribosome-binding protein
MILRGSMFQYRTSNFSPSVTAIQEHLGAVEKELEKIGRIAGRQTSAAAATAADQVGDAISTILSEMVDRFRKGGQAAGDQAERLGNQALDLSAKYGRDALQRLAGETEQRPLLTIGVAIGIGILIGATVLGSVSGGSRRRH